jgi:type IV pilus assembly protein PilQ
LQPYSSKDRGQISFDSRTNMLIVKDTEEVIDRMDKMIKTLDTQTPQVLIEAKIVEIYENMARDIGLNSPGFNFLKAGPALAPGMPRFSLSSVTSESVNFTEVAGLNLFRLGRNVALNFKLSLMESQSKGKIVSSPRIITQDKKKAEIKLADSRSYRTITNAGNASMENWQQLDAILQLSVTPQVTNDGSISLQVAIKKEDFTDELVGQGAPPNRKSREVTTDILVENGSTVVIGGVYSYEKTESHSGIPFLKDIPIIGWLFRSKYNPSNKKNELVIFLTPRIINQVEAGMITMNEASSP